MALLQGGGQPVQTLIQTVASGGAASLDVPLSVAQTVKTQLVGHLGGAHGVRQILFVGKNKQHRFSQLVLIQHAVHLISGGISTVSVVGINHEDEALSVLVVVSPQRSNLVLSSNIPHSETNILVLNSLDIETNGRNSRNDLTKLQFVQDSGLNY